MRRIRAMSRKKQVGLALVVLWLFGFTVSHIPGVWPDETKAEARPAKVRPAPPKVWAGLTESEAVAQSYRDEFYAGVHIATPPNFATRAQFDKAVAYGLMQGPQAERVRCRGREMWSVSYRHSTYPTAWFETRRVGFNAFLCEDAHYDPTGFDSMTVRHR